MAVLVKTETCSASLRQAADATREQRQTGVDRYVYIYIYFSGATSVNPDYIYIYIVQVYNLVSEIPITEKLKQPEMYSAQFEPVYV